MSVEAGHEEFPKRSSFFFLRSWVHTSHAWQAACAGTGLLALAAFVETAEARGLRVARGRTVQAWRTPVELAGRPEVLYIKCYHYEAERFGHWARASRAWREARNYLTFPRLGIPGPEPIAVGEERVGYSLRRAVIVTREIPDTLDLETAIGTPEFRSDGALRRSLLSHAAALAGGAHRQHFYHRDLKVRNLLVQGFPSRDSRLFWIDCPLGGFYWLGRGHLAAADIGDMGKSLRPAVSAEEWAAFRRAYAAARKAPWQGGLAAGGVARQDLPRDGIRV